MTDLLESYRPSSLDASPPEPVSTEATSLSLQAFGAGSDPASVVLMARAAAGDVTGTHVLNLNGLRSALEDLADGRGTELLVGEAMVELPATSEDVAVPLHPLLVSGTVQDWLKVIDREVGDLLPMDEHLPETDPLRSDAEPVPFSILDSD